jgi:hypothetical protein
MGGGIVMSYPDNKKTWSVGDFVIHSGDAKVTSMVMRVIAIEPSKLILDQSGNPLGIRPIYVTEYLHPKHIVKIGKKYSKRKLYRNVMEDLLDPLDFPDTISLNFGKSWANFARAFNDKK